MYRRKEIYKLRPSQLSPGRPWAEPEIESVRQTAGTLHAKLIARQINRSYESLRQMCKRRGILLRVRS